MRFDEQKAAQAAALFLLHRGGRMHYMKLIKLLYLADREALLKWGRPITTDCYVSMAHGPVVSRIYDLINKRHMPKEHWSKLISSPLGDKEVELIAGSVPTTKLSRAEEKLINEIHDQYGHWNRYRLIDEVLHKLPEWEDPGQSSTPITIAAILKAGGDDESEIKAILEELDAESVG